MWVRFPLAAMHSIWFWVWMAGFLLLMVPAVMTNLTHPDPAEHYPAGHVLLAACWPVWVILGLLAVAAEPVLDWYFDNKPKGL